MSVSKTVITLPVRVHRRAMKRQTRIRAEEIEQENTRYFKGKRDLPPLIKCRRPELNHFQGQVYAPFTKLPLATEHWASRSTIGDFFSFQPFRGASATSWHKWETIEQEKYIQLSDKEPVNKPDFTRYNLDQRIIQTLDRCGFKHPTNIQNAALPGLLEGQSAVLAAETGNGKTLAFLLPIIQRILALKESGTLSGRRLNSPLALVATPGRELAMQISEVASHLGSFLGLSVRLAMGSNIDQKLLFGKRSEVDLLIGSIGGLVKMFDGKLFHSDHIQALVLDEADTLVDDTFRGLTVNLMRKMSYQQLVLASASFPGSMKEALNPVLDTDVIPVIRTHHLHRVLPHIHQKFIRAPKVDRTDYLLDLIENDLARKRPVLIFSNKASTAAYVNQWLSEQGIDSLLFSGANMNPKTRGRNLQDFLRGTTNVLSCTDLVSRGIDTSRVHHVVNYDFPSNMSDYIHRVGRVGRVGSTQNFGKVSSLVCGQISIKLVQELERSVRLNKEIPHVDSEVVRVMKQQE